MIENNAGIQCAEDQAQAMSTGRCSRNGIDRDPVQRRHARATERRLAIQGFSHAATAEILRRTTVMPVNMKRSISKGCGDGKSACAARARCAPESCKSKITQINSAVRDVPTPRIYAGERCRTRSDFWRPNPDDRGGRTPRRTPAASGATSQPSNRERLLTPREASAFLRVSKSWLAKARMRGDGPPYLKIGRSIRYPEGALLRWTKGHLHLSTSER